MEEAKRFGSRLKELRIQAGLTQRELAEKVNVDFTYLSKIENGVLPPPSEKVILQLDEVLNADKDELMALAGKIPADIAEILKNRKTMQMLRSDNARQKARATREKKTMSIPKLSTPIKKLSKIAVPIMLVLAVASSLWYAAPTQALEIAITAPPNGDLGSQHTLTVTVTLEANELVPIQSINLEIYNVSDETKKATLENLPQVDSAAQSHTIAEGSTSGSATVAADANAAWEGGYTTGPGVAYWQGTAYSFGASHGYSYGGELTRITYTVNWTSPTGWPAGSYKIKALLTASGPDLTKTFTETSSAFSLATADAGGGGGGGGTTTVTSTKVEAMTDNAAAATIANLTDKAAAAVLKDVSTTKAASIMEKLTDAKAASIMENLTDVKAASILEKLSTNKGAATLEKLTGKKAASVVEKVETKKAATVLEKVTSRKTAEILRDVTANKASAIMQELTTEKLNDTIPEMSPESLTARLPGLTAAKLYSIDKVVLFKSLPNAPTEKLTGEVTPEALAGLTLPDVVSITSGGETYLAIRTGADGWVIIAATPAPIDQIMIKTKRALTNVKTIVSVLEERPLEVLSDLPDEKIVRTYIKISFENIVPEEDIDIGHMGFYVEREWLEQNSIHNWSVALNKYDPGLNKWISLPTKRVGEDDSNIHYTSVITNFSSSAFAITGTETVPALEFEATNLSISPNNARVGEDVTITADISNLADQGGTYVVTLWVNDTVEAGKEVTLGTNEEKSVSFTVSNKAEGDYEVRLDRLFGSFSITAEPAPAPAPAPTPAPAPPKPPITPAPAPAPAPTTPPPTPPVPPQAPSVTPTNWWFIGGGIIAVAIIIAVVAWILVARRRNY